MSAKKDLRTTLLTILLLMNFSLIFAQSKAASTADSTSRSVEKSQFLIRTEHNGKVKYVECALPNFYFHNATASFSGDSLAVDEVSEFTNKGGADDGYHAFTFFLIKGDVIEACNAAGDFKNQPEGFYTLSRFSYPLSIRPEAFKGKNIETIENHPLFKKDALVDKVAVKLVTGIKAFPELLTKPISTSVENMLGQLPTDISADN